MRALDMIQENLELDATHISVVAIQNGPTPDGPNDVLVRETQTKRTTPPAFRKTERILEGVLLHHLSCNVVRSTSISALSLANR